MEQLKSRYRDGKYFEGIRGRFLQSLLTQQMRKSNWNFTLFTFKHSTFE